MESKYNRVLNISSKNWVKKNSTRYSQNSEIMDPLLPTEEQVFWVMKNGKQSRTFVKKFINLDWKKVG